MNKEHFEILEREERRFQRNLRRKRVVFLEKTMICMIICCIASVSILVCAKDSTMEEDIYAISYTEFVQPIAGVQLALAENLENVEISTLSQVAFDNVLSSNEAFVQEQIIEENILLEEPKREDIYIYYCSDEDRLLFEQIVSAETYNFWSVDEDLAIASVIINRLNSEGLSFNYDTIGEVLRDDGEFETYSNGRYLDVEITNEAKEAVDRALKGETNLESDILFFCTKEYYNVCDSDDFFKTLNPVESIRNVLFFTP